jgi:hypothetical protein
VTAVERRQVTIDWDDLETALTWHDPEGSRHFLDLATGEVVFWTRYGEGPSSEAIDERLADRRLIPIDPLPPSVEYGWMEEFAATVREAALRRQLEGALSGSHPFRRFKDILAGHRVERERWFAFHGERVREAAREWLEENGMDQATALRARPER